MQLPELPGSYDYEHNYDYRLEFDGSENLMIMLVEVLL